MPLPVMILKAYNKTLTVGLKVWDYFSSKPRKDMKKRRAELEALNRQAQLDGDLDALRRTRAEINEIDRKLDVREYT